MIAWRVLQSEWKDVYVHIYYKRDPFLADPGVRVKKQKAKLSICPDEYRGNHNDDHPKYHGFL